jgi:pilus assembly protein CpaB
MNRRRLLAIIAAIVLTLFGTFVLIAFVNSAENRAREGTDVVEVLVAAEEIPAGTPAAELAENASVTRQPVLPSSVQNGAVSDLNDLGNHVAVQDILAGQQIVDLQFDNPGQQRRSGAGRIPEGREIVTVSLEPQRAVDGEIAEGDLVGVVVSLEGTSSGGGDGESESFGASGEDAFSAMVLAGVKVAKVSGVDPETGATDDVITVSLEVDQPAVERIVYGAEFGRLWLTRQSEGITADRDELDRQRLLDTLGSGG